MIEEILLKNYKNKYIFAIYDEAKSFHSNATLSICSKPSCVLKEEDVLERVDTIYHKSPEYHFL